ncbi:hypothetical protein V7139_21755, partial [Neobacillus drentensis]|uniref:hypothetical protein n=1 Tax=Neobacillus drentensis TaxID=220684 RepID=UPI003001A3ED
NYLIIVFLLLNKPMPIVLMISQSPTNILVSAKEPVLGSIVTFTVFFFDTNSSTAFLKAI